MVKHKASTCEAVFPALQEGRSRHRGRVALWIEVRHEEQAFADYIALINPGYPQGVHHRRWWAVWSDLGSSVTCSSVDLEREDVGTSRRQGGSERTLQRVQS